MKSTPGEVSVKCVKATQGERRAAVSKKWVNVRPGGGIEDRMSQVTFVDRPSDAWSMPQGVVPKCIWPDTG